MPWPGTGEKEGEEKKKRLVSKKREGRFFGDFTYKSGKRKGEFFSPPQKSAGRGQFP